MVNFKKILCPYDFSENADEALRYAVKLANPNTEICLLNIIQLPYLIDPYGFVYYDEKADQLKKDVESAMEKKINELNERYKGFVFSPHIAVNNDPAEVILQKQKEAGCEMVIMGSHGRKGLKRLLMGSVAETVLREADCPVLIIKHK
ncbi:MAG: universal stress protein [Saprospiraceae bacterium]|jgi:universal stress protein A|nr:universal stress protein [Saprospiraceae bacterium]